MEQCQSDYPGNVSNQEIVEDHIEFAKRLAHRFYSKRSHSQAEIDDLVSSAYLGLCEAGSRYNKEKNDRFQTYSYFRIVGSMYEYLKTSGGISRLEYKRLSGEDRLKKKEPLHFAENLKQLAHLRSQIEETGIRINIDEDKNVVELSYTGEELQDHSYYRMQVIARLRVALEELSEEMQKVIVGKYFEGKSLTELASEMPGMSKSRLSRLHGRALLLLRARVTELL
jgi:RNA polymerase sigma factor FliA